MDAIAFRSELKDDVIRIPDQYKGMFSTPVLVTIIRDVPHVTDEKRTFDESQAAYQRLLKFEGTVHRHTDRKKELAESRDEQYGKTDYELFQEACRLVKDSRDEDALLPDEIPRVHFRERIEL